MHASFNHLTVAQAKKEAEHYLETALPAARRFGLHPIKDQGIRGTI